MKLLAINSGSSTIKFRLYNMPEEEVIMKGSFEQIGSKDSFYLLKMNGVKEEVKTELKDHQDAVNLLLKLLVDKNAVDSLSEIEAVGHRVVHGGNKYSSSVLVTDRVLMEIDSIKDFAPLHNPASLMGIEAFKKEIPNAKEVVCFDTAFHQTMHERDFLYSVPYDWYVKYDIRKYGFHGLSHKFITEKMKTVLNKDKVNLIICHIGNGASISCVKESECIDTSMGFTPNSGLMMGTRCGDIDYSIIGYIMEKENLTYKEVDNILNKESGLLGIAGMNDLRDIDRAYESNDKKVIKAIDMYTRRIANYIAQYYIRLDGKVDGIVFTAGGGENDSIIRAEALKKVKSLGVELDEEKNNNTIARKGVEGIITTDNSLINAYVYGTDEELMIAQDTYNLVK